MDLSEKDEALVDHLRGGDFNHLYKKAEQCQNKQIEQQELCITSRGDVISENASGRLDGWTAAAVAATRGEKKGANVGERIPAHLLEKADDTIGLKGLGNVSVNMVNNSALNSGVGENNGDNDENNGEYDDFLELQRIRKQRIAQMQREKKMTDHWKSLGHGQLTLLEDEIAFFKQVKPHERAIMVIHRADISPEDTRSFLSYLPALAKKHLETKFFHLLEEKANFLLKMLDIPEGLPVLFILRHGEVICRIAKIILNHPEMTAPKFEKLLKSRDAFGEGGESSEDSDTDFD